MKKDKDKSKKGHESTIGKIIYGFLLFLPLFAIGTTCLISTFNMSGKEESEITYKYETNEVNSANDLIEGRIYHYKFDVTADTQFQNIAEFYEIYNINGNANTQITTSKLDGRYLRIYQINLNIGVYDQQNDNIVTISNIPNGKFECDVIYKDINYLDNWQNYTITNFNVIDYVETHNLNAEEVFYNSIDKVQQSPLFNWTTNSLLYTGMNEFTTSLSITTPFIPLLLTYWLIISLVYFLYDIVLVILTVLHRKIHNLQDSI